MFTEQNCKDVGITLGMPEEKSEYFYHHYNRQGWVFGNGQEMTDLKSAMWWWKNNNYRFENKENKKQKLWPIQGKRCSERGCGMPAVYKWTSGSGYDFWYCFEHIPRHIKKKIEDKYE